MPAGGAQLADAWYDESDLTDAAALGTEGGRRLAAELGHVLVYLPQDLLRRQAALLAALAGVLPTTAVVGLTRRDDADAGVRRSPGRGRPPPGPGRDAVPALPVAAGRTLVLTASDADDEVRAAVRQVVRAAFDGTPLEQVAILYGAPRPYGRLVHEHLAAAGVPRNGAAVRPLAASVVGRTLVDLLALPDHGFRRGDVLGVLARAPGSAAAPVATWERLSPRQAGVVAGRADWDRLLDRLAREYDRRADEAERQWAEVQARLAPAEGGPGDGDTDAADPGDPGDAELPARPVGCACPAARPSAATCAAWCSRWSTR